MIEMSDVELSKLVTLLGEAQDAFMKQDRDATHAVAALARMWLLASINDGFWRVSVNTALLTATTLDIFMPEFHGELGVLARRMSSHLRGRIAAYEAEIRKLDSMSRH